MQSFYEWLMEKTERQDRVGDLARDAQYDDEFPKTSQSYREVFDHLRYMTDWSAVFETLQIAWREYAPEDETWLVDPEEAGEDELHAEEQDNAGT